MCGIAGIMALHPGDPGIEAATLHDMCRMIRHRGPDADGYYVNPQRTVGLGHVRLSVIDPQRGHQPMSSADQKLVLSYNGEVYGYQKMRHELQERGHRFLTRCDTEVVLHLYKEKGLAFVDDLRGEYAFALWDAERERLIIVRDRFGTKPLYYTTQGNRLRFSSEIKGIFGDRTVRRELNFRTIVEQMMRADSAARTTFEDIHILSPGHMMIVENGQISIKKYWDIDFPAQTQPQHHYPLEYYAETMKELLTEAVKTRMVADVEVGCFLSGGLDSSIVAALMQQLSDQPVKTFSIGFTDTPYDESPYAQLVADHIGSDHHCLRFSHRDLALAFPLANYHCEHLVQLIDGAGIYLLSKYASQFVKAILVGTGSDEITLGYPWFKTAKLLEYWHPGRAALLRTLISNRETARKGQDLTESDQSDLQDMIKRFGYYPISVDNIVEMEKIAFPLFADEALDQARRYDARNIYLEDIDRSYLDGRNLLQQNRYEFLKKTFHTYMVQYLGGQNEMANSIEGRLPFLDYDFVNFARQIPPNYHLFGLRDKNLIRMAFADTLPKTIIRRTKHGYSSPILSPFLGEDCPDYFHEMLSERSLKRTGLFKSDQVQEFIAVARRLEFGDQRSTLYERLVIFVLSVQLLHHMFIENLPSGGQVPQYA